MANWWVSSASNSPGGWIGSYQHSTTYTNLAAVLAATSPAWAAGDIIYVDSTHAYNYSAATTNNFGAYATTSAILSVNYSTGVLTAGSSTGEGTNAAVSMIIEGNLYIYGLNFTIASGTSTGSSYIEIGGNAGRDAMTIDNSIIKMAGTSATNVIYFGFAQNNMSNLKMKNCTFNLTNTAHKLSCYGGNVVFENCGLAGTAPTALFSITEFSSYVDCHSCDWSTASALILASSTYTMNMKFNNCKLPSTLTSGTHTGPGGVMFEITGCYAGSDTVLGYYYQDGCGIISNDTGTYLTSGGASFTDYSGSTVTESLKMVPNSTYANWYNPLCGPWLDAYVSTTGSHTFTVNVAYSNASALTNKDLWMELEYMGDAGDSKSTHVVNGSTVGSDGVHLNVMDATGSAWTDVHGTYPWTGSGLASNQKVHNLALTETINQIGFARARICAANTAAGMTIWVDPQLQVS